MEKGISEIINLAAPHTWAASVMPSLFALALCYRRTGAILPDMAACLLLIAVLMQSAANALNDYMDYIKGTDTLENSDDPTDAVIVYGLKPKTARNTGIIFLALAALIGIYVIYRSGWIPLVIGIIGALVVVLYSCGKVPFSYLPIGEALSGFVMGGLIVLAGVYMLTGVLDYYVLFEALPIIIGIGMIMFSNNGCDIDRDIVAGRHTLPIIMGRKRTVGAYRVMLILWAVTPIIVFLVENRPVSILVYILGSFSFVGFIAKQLGLQLGPEMRGLVMMGINYLTILLSFTYLASVLMG